MLRGNLNPPLTQNSTNPERHGQNLIREPQASGFPGPIYSCGGAHKATCTSVVIYLLPTEKQQSVGLGTGTLVTVRLRLSPDERNMDGVSPASKAVNVTLNCSAGKQSATVTGGQLLGHISAARVWEVLPRHTLWLLVCQRSTQEQRCKGSRTLLVR